MSASIRRDVSIHNDLVAARGVQADIETALVAHAFGEGDLFAIRLALEEAFVNAVKHGNRLDPQKSLHIRYSIDSELFAIRVTDEGNGFDPGSVPDPTSPEFIERPCGRGLLLIRHYMNDVTYSDGGRTLSMCRPRSVS